MRVLTSTDVGSTSNSVTAADLDAARTTNSNVLAVLGPNEVDAVQNWKYYYLDFVHNPDEITTSTAFANLRLVDTVFNNNLGLLFLRIIDHMRHTYEGLNDSLANGGAGQTDCGMIMPSIIKSSRSKGNQDFTIYDFFNYEDMTTNVRLRAGDLFQWCDAGQVHIHVEHSIIEDPWASNPIARVDAAISPYHYWRAKLDNETYRAGLGLPTLPRPLVQGESGVPVQGDGINVDWRPMLSQLRRLKYGMVNAGSLFYSCIMILTYSAGKSSNYGYNLLTPGGLTSVTDFSIDTANRGAGYVVGSKYDVVYPSGSGLPAKFRVTSVNGSGGITGIRMNYTGYWNTVPPSNVPLVAPSGGTAARLNLTYETPPANVPLGDLGERDADYLHEVFDYRKYDISKLPVISNLTYSIPIVAKDWRSYWKDWIVWFLETQDPIDDVATARMMTNRAHLPNVSQSSGSLRNVVWRCAFWSSKRKPMTAVQAIFANSYLDASGEHNGLNTIYVTAAVEYNGVTTPLPFGGAREATITPGGLATTNLVNVSIPANTQFWIRHNVRTANAGEKYPTGYTTRTDFGEGFSSVNAVTQVDGTGVLSGNTSSAMYAPVAVLGTSVESNPPNVVIIGSSSAWGQGENFASIPVPGDRGYLSRLVSNNMGQSVLVCPSESLAQWISASAIRMAIINAIRPTHVILQLGSNDILGGATVATMQSRLQTVWNQIAASGAKVIQVTFTPTSTGTFTTTSGQTSTFNTVRVPVNNFIRGLPAPLAGVIDACRVAESAPDSGIWRVDGGAWTSDGTHTIRHADMAAGLDLSVIS